jgi:hypothetical protein
VAELVDAPDSKSGDGDIVPVRFRPSVPSKDFIPKKKTRKPQGFAGFLLSKNLKESKCNNFKAGRIQLRSAIAPK